jgi:hypothetical protein
MPAGASKQGLVAKLHSDGGDWAQIEEIRNLGSTLIHEPLGDDWSALGDDFRTFLQAEMAEKCLTGAGC